MPHSLEDALSQRRLVVVVLRLMVETDGRLGASEAADVEADDRHRFSGWTELEGTVRAIVTAAASRPPSAAELDEGEQ